MKRGERKPKKRRLRKKLGLLNYLEMDERKRRKIGKILAQEGVLKCG